MSYIVDGRKALIAFPAEMRRRTAKRGPSVDVVAAIWHDGDTDYGNQFGPDNRGERHGTDHNDGPCR